MFSKYKWLIIVVGAALLAGFISLLYMRIAHLESEISEKKVEIAGWQSNCTAQETEINLLKADQIAGKLAEAALEKQVRDAKKACAGYVTTESLIRDTFYKPGTTNAGVQPGNQEVLDSEASARSADLLNSILGRLR